MNQMDNPPPMFGGADAVNIVGALKTFVSVHQTLLNTIIGKHGILSLFFFTEPVRVALVSLEAAVDVSNACIRSHIRFAHISCQSFALALIDMIPTQAPAANEQFNSLSITINAAIQVYS
jgi:hypothetical protein